LDPGTVEVGSRNRIYDRDHDSSTSSFGSEIFSTVDENGSQQFLHLLYTAQDVFFTVATVRRCGWPLGFRRLGVLSFIQTGCFSWKSIMH
jgi:hypothetical protein